MRVRHHHEPLSAALERREERLCVRSVADQVRELDVQRYDVELRVARPVVEAIELEPCSVLAHVREEMRACVVVADAVALGVALGQPVVPERVVEVEIEQRAVHVEQHGVDSRPVERCFHGRGFYGLAVLAARS